MFTVIICTYNPNWTKLKRVLESLHAQDYPCSQWEWIIVDNASTEAVRTQLPDFCVDRIKIIEEPEPGLTPARIAGIRSASHEWLILIDDDNIVAPNYLSQSDIIIQQHPNIGAFGCALIPEYEQAPSNDVLPYLFMLAIRQPQKDVIDNSYSWDSTPFGAGMVVRKSVAEAYVNLLETDEMRKGLDRKGNSLMSSGDVDLAHTAIDMGFLTGVFTSLQITHIIPASRVSKPYLKKMMLYNALSNHLLFYIRFKRIPSKLSFKKQIKKYWRCLKRGNWFDLEMLYANIQGRNEAIRRIKQIELNSRHR